VLRRHDAWGQHRRSRHRRRATAKSEERALTGTVVLGLAEPGEA
jgi:hypothetical protein